MAQACLERVTGAHASNCEHLVTSRAKFGSDGIVGFPAIPLSCAQFARVPQLMQNKATQLCIATNLQLLMNITHSTSGSDCVMALGGIYALSHLIWHLAVTPSGQGPYPTAPGVPLICLLHTMSSLLRKCHKLFFCRFDNVDFIELMTIASIMQCCCDKVLYCLKYAFCRRRFAGYSRYFLQYPSEPHEPQRTCFAKVTV